MSNLKVGIHVIFLKASTDSEKMGHAFFYRVFAIAIACSSAAAQTPLTAYTNANGFLDVQRLTCAPLAGTFQEDADMLTT